MITGRLIGIDHGLKRIGIAISDAIGLTAREHSIIANDDTLAAIERIRQIASEQFVIAFVVGIPHNFPSDGADDTQADAVHEWIALFKSHVSLPIIEWDEQLSSADARALARNQKRPPRAPIDDLAARVILGSYLDAVRDGLAPPPSNE